MNEYEYETFETFESLYSPYPYSAGASRSGTGTGDGLSLRQPPGGLYESDTLHRVQDLEALEAFISPTHSQLRLS